MVVVQIVSIIGSAIILAAYGAQQFGYLDEKTVPYQLGNLVGAIILTVVGIIYVQLGFILLEGMWAMFSAYGLIKVLQSRRGRPSRVS